MEVHEAATCYDIDAEAVAELAEDIGKRGLIRPIETFHGAIIDGRQRLAACNIAGVEPRFTAIETDDPIAYALSCAMGRDRKPGARAIAAARANGMYAKLAAEAKERQREHGKTAPGKPKESLPTNLSEVIKKGDGDTRKKVADITGVSHGTMQSAVTVVKQAVPEVVKAVSDGRMAVSYAARVAREDPVEQRRIVETAKPKSKIKPPKPSPFCSS